MKNLIVTLLMMAAACTATLAQPDAGAVINAGIRQALAEGRSYYDIPAGTHTLRSQITIPPSTSGFTLRGAGSNQTKLLTPEWVGSQAITVGSEVLLHNNWGLTNRENRNVVPAREGTTSITLASGSAPISPGFYVIYSDEQVSHRTAPSVVIRYAAEIVQVLHYDEIRRQATIDVPLGRSYRENPRLANVKDQICQNITVSGIAMDGFVASNGGGMGGLVKVGLANGVVLEDLKIENYGSGAVSLNLCRNVQVEAVDISNASSLGPGGGYGVHVMRSRFVSIRDSVARTSRHGFIFHSGSMDGLVEDSQGYSTVGADFDTHGMDELRITFRRCTGTTGWGIGNDAWVLGGRGHVIEDCTLGSGYVGPNVASLLVRRSTTGDEPGTIKLMIWSEANGAPGDIRFEDCTFKGSGRLLGFFGTQKFRRLSFVRCNFLSDWKTIEINNAVGAINFLGCYFEARSPGDGMFCIWSGEQGGTLVIRDSTFKQVNNGQFAFWIYNPACKVRATIINNRLISPTATKFFNGSTKGIMSKNTVIRP